MNEFNLRLGQNRPCHGRVFSCIRTLQVLRLGGVEEGAAVNPCRKGSFMTDILDYISTWSAIKWVVLVLIAGFIGQFGRMMAEAIANRIRLRRAKKNPTAAGRQETEETKTLNAGAVRESGLSGSVQETPGLPAGAPASDFPSRPWPSPIAPDKKALKTMAKARKKEAKREGKE
jgi:hypothetical protein